MAAPSLTEKIVDGALGITPANAEDIAVKMGVCSGGVPNRVYQFSDQGTLVATLGTGPLVDAAALSLATAGGPVWCVPLNPSISGTNAMQAVTHVGSGTSVMTITGTPNDALELEVVVTTGNALVSSGSVIVKYSLDGGATFVAGINIVAGGTYVVPGTGLTLHFTTSGSAVLNDVYSSTSELVGDVSAIAPGTGNTGTTVLTIGGTPNDDYDILVTIVTGAALVSGGTSSFTYSLDGGNTVSAATALPSSGNFTLPGTGLALSFVTSGSTVAGDTFAALAAAPGYGINDITAGVSALVVLGQTFGFIHLVGQAATVNASAALFAALDTLMSSLETTDFIFTWLVMECPKDTDTNILAAFNGAAAASRRLMVCAGTAYVVSPTTGLVIEQSSAWEITARAALVKEAEDLAFVGRGPVQGIPTKTATGVVGLVRDERLTPGLDAAQFATLTTIIDVDGVFITNGRLMSPTGSDYGLAQFRRVMDDACRTTRRILLPYMSDSLELNPDGTIDEREARHIEDEADAELVQELVTTTQAVAVGVHISRTQNIESTETMPTDVRVQPLGYSKFITTTIGFKNPNLSAS